MKTETEIGWCGHQSRSVGSHQELGEGRNRFSPRASGKSMAYKHSSCRPVASRTVRK